jgi:polyisoprenyl-phosphate glycosyltransferase
MISIVIPIYNEADILDLLQQRLIGASPLWKEEFEIILVDDGSSDGSLEKMKRMVLEDGRIRVIKLSRNFGHQPAISAGIMAAKGDAVVVMDGDLQDPPEELPQFLEKWREGYHVVYAIRTKRKEGLFKRLAYKAFYRILARISDIDIPIDSGDFCVMDRKVVDALNKNMPERIRFVRGLRAFAGFKQIGVAYERAERAGGEVKYTFRKLLKLAVDGIFDFSTFPLRLATYLGLIISIPSFLLGLFFILHRLLDFKVLGYSPQDTPGMATLAVAMFFLGGVVLVILGVMGEYLGRIYIEVKKRPYYIVEEEIAHQKKTQS